MKKSSEKKGVMEKGEKELESAIAKENTENIVVNVEELKVGQKILQNTVSNVNSAVEKLLNFMKIVFVGGMLYLFSSPNEKSLEPKTGKNINRQKSGKISSSK